MIYKTNSGYGVNFNQLVQNGNFENGTTGFGSRWFISPKTVSSGVCMINGSISGADTYNAPNISITTANCPDFVIGHKYLTLAECKSVNLVISVGLAFGEDIFRDYQAINDSDFTQCYWFTDCTKTNKIFGLLGGKSSQSTTVQASFQLKNFQLFDLTQDFGAGNEPTTVAEFREMYSDDYYDYTLSQWQWSKKGKITSYPTPVIENGTTLLPIENHIVGLAKNGIGRIEIEGNSYQNGTPTPTSPIPIQSFNGSGDTVKLVGAGGKELQLPNSITLNNQTISLELNKVGTYADKLIIDKASGKVELVRKVTKYDLAIYSGIYTSNYNRVYIPSFNIEPEADAYTVTSALSDYYRATSIADMYNNRVDGTMAAGRAGYWGNGYLVLCDANFDGKTVEQIRTYLTGKTIIYRKRDASDTPIDITDATYQINGITYNVSDWLNFVDREIEIETDGLAQSNLSVDYEPTIIYNYAKRELPVGFVRLDYIESTGTQWIDTGVSIDENFSIEVECSIPSTIPNTFGSVFGVRSPSWFMFSIIGSASIDGGKGQINYLDSEYATAIPKDTFITIKMQSDGKVYLNGNLIKDFGFSITNSNNIYLFGSNNSGSIASRGQSGLKYKKVLINNNSGLVRNYISCYRYSDGIEGLYDTVGKQFYTNQGTGRFLRGNIIDGGILNNGN